MESLPLIIVADENIPAVEEAFAPFGTVRRVRGRELSAAHLQDADILLVRSVTRVDRALLAGTAVRFVGTATSGTDHLDRDYLRRRRIGFAHAPGSNANSVVEYVLGTVASVDDKLEQLLAGGVVGIVGYGHIGKALARRLQALGIDYRVYDPWLVQASIDRCSTLERVLQADVIALHCELTERRPWPSRHLLAETRLSAMRSDSLLINASRGAVIDNRALRAVLGRGRGPITVLDVWEGEPTIDPELLRLVRFGTPHIAGYSLDGKLLATGMLLQAACDYLGLPVSAPIAIRPPEPAFTLPPDLRGIALLRYLLLLHFDIHRDDRDLRAATLGLHPRLAASGFDRMRRHYPERRELSGLALAPGRLPAQDLARLHALGCVLPDDAGTTP